MSMCIFSTLPDEHVNILYSHRSTVSLMRLYPRSGFLLRSMQQKNLSS